MYMYMASGCADREPRLPVLIEEVKNKEFLSYQIVNSSLCNWHELLTGIKTKDSLALN